MSWGKCHDCGTSIHFVRMRGGNAMPVDPVPDERGNVIALKVGTGKYIDGYVSNPPGEIPTGCVRLMPHFASCSHPKHLPKGSPRPPTEEAQDALL